MTDPCQVCGSKHRTQVTSYKGAELYRCGNCGLVFRDPMPSVEEVCALWNDAYDGTTKSYFAKADKKMCRARGRIRQIRRYVAAGRFLDVGCNGGFVVEAASEQGFDAYGIDRDPVSIAYARNHYPGNTYWVGSMEAFDPGELRFDAVYCSDVIKHVPDVNPFVAAIVAAMAPGAVLYLTTPDISHWRQPRNEHRWESFRAPPCLHFSPKNLTLLLKRHGLEVFKRRLAFKPGIKMFAHKGP